MTDRLQEPSLVFLVPHAPPVDFLGKYFVSTLVENGFNVHYWDVGPIMGYDMSIETPPETSLMSYTRVKNKRQLEHLLRREKHAGAIFVPQISPSLEARRVLCRVEKSDVKTAFFGRGYLPLVSEPKTQRTQVLTILLSSQDKLSVLKRIGRAILFKLLPQPAPLDIIFTAGQLAEQIHEKDAKSIVRIQHFDVDTAAMAAHEPGDDMQEFLNCCVFLDDYLPFHPDFQIGNVPKIDPERYYVALNNFFDQVESVTRRPVVIAAHPKARYEKNPFSRRKVIFGKTHRLVKIASLVLAHQSTAVSFAVIFKKPLLLLFSNEMRAADYYVYALMLGTSQILGCPLIDFTQTTSPSNFQIQVDKSRYSEYYRRYLSNSNDPRSSAEIVVSTLKNWIATAETLGDLQPNGEKTWS